MSAVPRRRLDVGPGRDTIPWSWNQALKAIQDNFPAQDLDQYHSYICALAVVNNRTLKAAIRDAARMRKQREGNTP